ncbi:hypothetical protein ACFFGH_24035 [Lysobacter korlensis]|uniref:Secreted protein n=1 Tax=Lysobacter korlensis TaxID=553636 RepID=A0ABV6RVW2_9GAMM
MKKRFAAFVAVTLIAGMFSGCAAAESQSSAPSSPPAAPVETRAAAPVTAEPEPQARLVTVTAESIAVTADDGIGIATFDYFQPTDDLVVGLTEIFGFEPMKQRFGNQTSWDWGGFFLLDNDGPGDPPLYTNHFVQVTVPAVGEAEIETVDGIQVGDEAATIERRYPDQAHRVTAGDQPERLDVYVGAVPLPATGDDPPGANGRYEFSVALIAWDPDGTISEYRAPSPNFGV